MRNSSKRSPSQIAELLRSGGGVRAVKLILCIALFAAAAGAQSSTSYKIDTFAGGGVGDGGPAVQAHFYVGHDGFLLVAADGAGNVYVTDSGNNRIRKVDSTGAITTIAGTGEEGFSGDGGPAVQAALSYPAGVAVDGSGNVYVTGYESNRVRRIDTAGMISTFAGTGEEGFSGDGGPAAQAQLNVGTDGFLFVAADGAGNLYIADSGNNRIRKVDATGTITTIAGTGQIDFSGDGGPAVQAALSYPAGVAVDGSGNVYIADAGIHRVRRIDTAGVISTFAGSGEEGFSGDGGPAVQAALSYPVSVAVDGSGNLYVAGSESNRVRRIDTAGVISTFAGSGEEGFSGDGGPAVQAQLYYPSGVAVDGAGNLYIADTDNTRIRKVDSTGTITTIAGTGEYGFSGDGGPAVQAALSYPSGVAVDGAGNVYVTDSGNNRIRKVDATGTITTIAGTGEYGFSGDGGPAVQAALSYPEGVAVDGAGNVYVTDSGNNRIRKVDATGTITTIAGMGEYGFSGDGGPAVQAALDYPSGVAVDGAGNLFIADSGNNRIRKVDATGTITTIAGMGEYGFSGDGGPAVQAALDYPSGVAVDGAGNLFIADTVNDRIRKVDSAGVITTVAGTGDYGDGGPAVQAQLNGPRGVAVDGAGNVYIADTGNFLVRKLTPVGGSGTSPAGESFSFPDLGGWSTTSSGTEETVRVGYGRISAGTGSATPSGIAIFQFRDIQGVLIAEASVPATGLIQEGRIFAEVEGPVNTGLAIANPNDVPATISFYFTDTTGTHLGNGTFELGEHEQTAKFLNQEPFNEALPDGSPVLGTFTFESSVPIAVIALRGFTNEAGEFLVTTLPVAPLAPASEETVYIPHFAAGGGWVTQVILVNPTDSTITGTAGFLGPGSGTIAASPVILTLDDGSTGSDFDYSIPPRSSQRFTTANPFGELNAGSVRAVPDSGNATPSGLVVFSYAPAGKTLSEAGVPALPKGSAFRVYAEASGMSGQMGSISTGLAITNVGDTSNTVTLEVTHLDGSLAAAPEMLTLPPSGQVARFLNDIFSLPDNFFGVLRVTSAADIAIVALRLRVNENNEIKVTTLAPSNEMDPSTSEDRFFAHLADSGGWSTQFILFSGTAGQAAAGTLSFIDTAGQPWDLTTDSGVVTVPEPTPPATTPLAPADDRAALEALYDATNGANWSSNDNWKTDEPLGQWFGIRTNSDGRVTRLDLSENQLSGTIPAEIGNLTSLTDLLLGRNQLSGMIPAEIGSLTRLTWLELHVNQLSGTIPAEIGNLTSLKHLLLGSNQLSSTIPAELGNLTSLISLDLEVNQLSGTIPAEIGNLTHLAHLSVDIDTGLCLAPDFDLTSPFATATGLPVCSGTPTPKDPADDRAALEALYDATNGANWSSNDNWKTDEPLGQWFGVRINNSDGRVTRLDLSYNQLSGTIPAELGNLSSLTELELGGNQLSGTIPVELGNLTRLTTLDLNYNQLSGTIPAELGNLSSLTTLRLDDNQLSGTIPAELGNLTSLTWLELAGNQLSGTIPAELGNLTRLLVLSVDTDTGLCLAPDFDLTSPFATATGLPVCSTEPSGTSTPKDPPVIQMAVDDAIGAATNGEGLRTGGAPVTVWLDALFTFPSSAAAAVTYAGTTFSVSSTAPGVVSVSTTDVGPGVVLTPGADAGTAAVTIDARPEGQPAATPVASVRTRRGMPTATSPPSGSPSPWRVRARLLPPMSKP